MGDELKELAVWGLGIAFYVHTHVAAYRAGRDEGYRAGREDARLRRPWRYRPPD